MGSVMCDVVRGDCVSSKIKAKGIISTSRDRAALIDCVSSLDCWRIVVMEDDFISISWMCLETIFFGSGWPFV